MHYTWRLRDDRAPRPPQFETHLACSDAPLLAAFHAAERETRELLANRVRVAVEHNEPMQAFVRSLAAYTELQTRFAAAKARADMAKAAIADAVRAGIDPADAERALAKARREQDDLEDTMRERQSALAESRERACEAIPAVVREAHQQLHDPLFTARKRATESLLAGIGELLSDLAIAEARCLAWGVADVSAKDVVPALPFTPPPVTPSPKPEPEKPRTWNSYFASGLRY